MSFWRSEPEGASVRVKVQPKARRPGLFGAQPAADGERLKLAVTEAPEDGRANRAVCATLAGALGLPISAVTVSHGLTNREKTLRVAGDPAAIAARLESLR